MAIRHTAVSYYGFNYVEHAERDFREMLEHGCDTVILAITEFDMDFWFPNLNAIVKKAHELGLRVLADTWGIGSPSGQRIYGRGTECGLLQYKCFPRLFPGIVFETGT